VKNAEGQDRSLSEQILSKMLEQLKGKAGFDEATIRRLSESAKSGKLTNPDEVFKALEQSEGDRYETAGA